MEKQLKLFDTETPTNSTIQKIKEPELYEEYTYTSIKVYANEHNYDFDEVGKFIVGRHTILLTDDLANTITFIMVGHDYYQGAIYTCVYKD